MYINKKLFATLIIVSFIGFSSCSSDDDVADTTGPEITLGSPKNGETFPRGEDIHIDFDLEDPSGINNYKIDIHWGAGHTHSGVAVRNSAVEAEGDVAWNYQIIYDDKKGQTKAHVHVHTEDVPKNARLGEYHFGVLATDMLGNGSKKYINIQIVE